MNDDGVSLGGDLYPEGPFNSLNMLSLNAEQVIGQTIIVEDYLFNLLLFPFLQRTPFIFPLSAR